MTVNPGPSSAPRPLTDALQQHGAALRRLAAHLVGGAHADDLLQETAVAALQERRQVAQPVAFLRRVVRHLAGKHHRGTARRRRRESDAGVRDEVASPIEMAAQRETIDRLHAALMAVPEPARGALLLRYFEALTPAQIAARLGVPLPTVKSRLARGLELLRQRLGADERDWRAGLTAAFGLHGEVMKSTTAGVAGVMGMAMTSKVLVAAAAAAVLTWWVWLEVASPDAIVRHDAAVAAPVRDAGSAVGEAAAAGSVERVAVAADSNAVALHPEWPAPATVRGRCVDEFGKPLAGCRVVWNGMRNNEEELSKWVRTHYDPQWQNPPAQVTGEDGMFEWVVVPHEPLRFRLMVHCPGRVEMRRKWDARLSGDGIEPGATVALGDVVVPVGGALAGRVVDGDGQPVAGASVFYRAQSHAADDYPMRPYCQASARCAADGTFHAEGLLGGDYDIRVADSEVLSGGSVVVAGPSTWLEIVVARKQVDPGAMIVGTVVDDSGNPVAYAHLHAYTLGNRRDLRFGSTATSESDGSFVLLRDDRIRDEPVQFRATAAGFEVATSAVFDWGARGVRIEMRRGVDVALEVVDPDGRPVEEYAAWIVARDTGVRDAFCFGHQRQGRSLFVGVSRGRKLLLVEPRDRERMTLSRLTLVEVADPAPAHIRVQLPSPVERLVRVVDAAGAPVAGVCVQLEEQVEGAVPNAKSMSPEKYFSPDRSFEGMRLVRRAVTTDDGGEARLVGPGGHRFVVQVPGPRCLPLVVQDVRLDVVEPLVLEVSRGGSLRVKLGPRGIRDTLIGYASSGDGGSSVGAGLPQLWLRATPGGWKEPARPNCIATISPEGTATFDGVPPGTWHAAISFILAYGHNTYQQQVEEVGVVRIREGQVDEQNFDLSGLLPTTLDATVLRGREPLRNSRVTLRARGSAMGWETQLMVKTDADGRFTWNCRPGSYSIIAPSVSAETVVVSGGGRLVATFTLPVR
ncbi:MAG: sigma-70 family RNA polymerase sigma factor [Planctomycetes bacterium]|nr:sigma-70 family RNA polymerase sigma factor [Planctomycetota bacterium]